MSSPGAEGDDRTSATGYVVGAARRSIAICGLIVVFFAFAAVIAVLALFTDFDPWYERRYGTVGVGFAAVSSVCLVPWLAAGLVRAWPHRHRTLVVTGRAVEVQDFRGRFTIPLGRIEVIEAQQTKTGKRLRIWDVDGRRCVPMMLPKGSTWEAEAERLDAFARNWRARQRRGGATASSEP